MALAARSQALLQGRLKTCLKHRRNEFRAAKNDNYSGINSAPQWHLLFPSFLAVAPGGRNIFRQCQRNDCGGINSAFTKNNLVTLAQYCFRQRVCISTIGQAIHQHQQQTFCRGGQLRPRSKHGRHALLSQKFIILPGDDTTNHHQNVRPSDFL
ncbi:MAG: hypothetical protein RI973_1340 [Bacteroidota bacterium]